MPDFIIVTVVEEMPDFVIMTLVDEDARFSVMMTVVEEDARLCDDDFCRGRCQTLL